MHAREAHAQTLLHWQGEPHASVLPVWVRGITRRTRSIALSSRTPVGVPSPRGGSSPLGVRRRRRDPGDREGSSVHPGGMSVDAHKKDPDISVCAISRSSRGGELLPFPPVLVPPASAHPRASTRVRRPPVPPSPGPRRSECRAGQIERHHRDAESLKVRMCIGEARIDGLSVQVHDGIGGEMVHDLFGGSRRRRSCPCRSRRPELRACCHPRYGRPRSRAREWHVPDRRNTRVRERWRRQARKRDGDRAHSERSGWGQVNSYPRIGRMCHVCKSESFCLG